MEVSSPPLKLPSSASLVSKLGRSGSESGSGSGGTPEEELLCEVKADDDEGVCPPFEQLERDLLAPLELERLLREHCWPPSPGVVRAELEELPLLPLLELTWRQPALVDESDDRSSASIAATGLQRQT